MKNNKLYLGIDIGGSHITCALIDSADYSILPDSYCETAVNALGNAREILSAWTSAIRQCLGMTTGVISGVGVAMPGPFDYERGVSAISEVQKFDSLFGLDVRQAIRNILPDPKIPITFLNDATCFALGEHTAGAAQNWERCIVVTLGTGFGSTFLINGEPQVAGKGVPANGYLYDLPYKDGVADDYVSTRWFIARWNQMTGGKAQGVKELADNARSGDDRALELFNEFAENLARIIAPVVAGFKPEVLVIGGNIALAMDLFIEPLNHYLAENGISGIRIIQWQLGKNAPLIGATKHIEQHMHKKTTSENMEFRETEQFLAPAKVGASQPGDYDIYPAFPLGGGKIQHDIRQLASIIDSEKTVVIDGYIGVFWDQLIEALDAEFQHMGKTVHWFHTSVAMKSEAEIAAMIAPSLEADDSIFGRVTDKTLVDFFSPEKLNKIRPDGSADINILIGCGAALAGWKAPLIYVDLPKNELQFRMRAGCAFNLGSSRPKDNRDAYKQYYFVDWRVLNAHKCAVLPQIEWIIDEQRPGNYLFMKGCDLRKGLAGMARNFFRVRPWFEPGVWGGNYLKNHLKGLNTEVDNLAWSFELMTLENGLMFQSDDYRLEVSFDFLMYNSHQEVLGDCAGTFGYDFPIRFDFLDTFDGGNLSVQCHPRPEYIRERFGMPFTQDETYYILNCKNEPHVYLGFQENIDPEEFHAALVESQEKAEAIDIERFVQKHPARKHDFFLIPNGTIHASGKDNLVLEISSAPYIFTFKMYDWMRLDLDGRPRPINIEHGMNNLRFERKGEVVDRELICKPHIKERNEEYTLEHLPTHKDHFYDVYRYTFDREIFIKTENKCHVWMLVEGTSVIVETAEGMRQRFNYAETFVIPAAAQSYKIMNEGNEPAMMVKSFVKDEFKT